MDYHYQAPSPEPTPNTTTVLIFGILGLSFSCSFYLSFLGIIFSALCLSHAGEYYRITGQLTGKVRVGRILSRIGLILGITMSAFLLLLILSWCITHATLLKHY